MSPHTSGLNLRGPSWLSPSLRLAKVPELPKAVHPQFRTRNSRGKIVVEPKTHRPHRRQRQRRASTAGQQHRERLPFVLHHTNPPSPPPYLWFFFCSSYCFYLFTPDKCTLPEFDHTQLGVRLRRCCSCWFTSLCLDGVSPTLHALPVPVRITRVLVVGLEK